MLALCRRFIYRSCNMDPVTLQNNLTRLCGQFSDPSLEAAQLAEALPFSRAHSPAGFEAIATSRQDLATRRVKELIRQHTSRDQPTCTESWLHTDDCVFYYLSGFGYPHTEAGFLFRNSLAAGGLASPFDSGALWEWLDWPGCPPAGTTAQQSKDQRAAAARDFLASHTMSAAECRAYLAQILTHRFASPADYLGGLDPIPHDPHGLSPCPGKQVDHRRWTFEMRLPTDHPDFPSPPPPLPGPHLEAVFHRESIASSSQVKQFLRDCRLAGVRRVSFRPRGNEDAFKALKRAGLDYLEAKLNVAIPRTT
jgi:hypothetical protein